MIRFLVGLFLMARVLFQRLDVNLEICLQLWRSQTPIVEVMHRVPESRKQALIARLDLMFPLASKPNSLCGSQVHFQRQTHQIVHL